MYSLFFIAKNNLKKHKGEVAILFTLIFLAASLLFSSLSLLLSGQNIINECKDTHHTSDIMIFQNTPMNLVSNTPEDIMNYTKEFHETIAALPGTKLCESIPIVEWPADYYYGSQTEEDSLSYEFFIQDSSKPTYLNSYPEEYIDLQDNEIVLPYHLSSSVKKGDAFHISANGMSFDFIVKGYMENLYFATTMNISGFPALVSPNVFQEIYENVDPNMCGSFVYCSVEDGVDLTDYELSVKRAFPEAAPVSVKVDIMEMGAMVLSGMASAIILLFTIVLVGLAIIIMHFSIKNFIEMNIQNIGLLQANGYTAKALRWSCIMEEMLICGFATLLAIAVGIFLSPVLSSLQGMLMGLTGFSGVCIPALLSTLIGIPLLVFLGTLLASRSYKKLTVLEALRSGISNHNFKKNHFALDKSSMPLDLALSGKNIFGRPKKSLFIILIIALLTFSSCLGFTLFENFAMDQTAMLKLVGFEASEVQITANGDEALLSDLRNDPKVERVLTSSTLSSIEFTHLENTRSIGVDTYGDLSHLEYEYLLEGHLPENENEIVLTFIEAKNLDAKIGDVVDVKTTNNSGTVPFTICGIDQKINNLGNRALVSEEGAKRINPDYKFGTIMIYLKDKTQAKAYMKELAERYPLNNVMLIDDLIGSTMTTLTTTMVAICAIFVSLTCFVVILTEILLTRSQIIRERSELGVSKALGYTSGELVRRMIMSNLPLVVIGVLAGIVLHLLLADRFMLLGLGLFGIKQTNLSTNPLWFLLTMVIIVACALITSFLNSRSISKLEPVRILKEE